ncbi:aa3-type cytochrome c oxidase subunit IV [Paracoccus aurantiacus]|uniref:Aa3-type cytochrome c oxidase subunit IV n=1 Tax=Paracoccus aurantiacus TaxID=2599412 RepID=A0A5C6S1I5_9RHOB|nr:aa3-type cytochrome c oxidase subunit IV [Paracoccus aurantiacus]TXB68095.1 aa3-type cytochrome c oxidase subunit IV [Paracoccus aurantiacus]
MAEQKTTDHPHVATEHAHATGEHVHGSMDVRDHEKTFAGFVRLATWVCILSGAVLIFMALTNS